MIVELFLANRWRPNFVAINLIGSSKTGLLNTNTLNVSSDCGVNHQWHNHITKSNKIWIICAYLFHGISCISGLVFCLRIVNDIELFKQITEVFSFCRNKLDGNDYAIKRIILDSKDERFNRRVTREAKLFSKLNHPNVVRYYSAWIEQASTREAGSASNGSEVNQKEETEGM